MTLATVLCEIRRLAVVGLVAWSEGISIGDDIHLSGDKEGILARTSSLVLSIDVESGPSSGRLGNSGSIVSLADGLENLLSPDVGLDGGSVKQSEVSLVGLGRSSGPESNQAGSSSQRPEFNLSSVVGVSQLVVVGRTSLSRSDLVDESEGSVGQVEEGIGHGRSGVDGRVISIGNGNEMLLSDELLEEELGLVWDKELVLGSNDDQLGHVDEGIVVDGILDVGDVVEVGVGNLRSDSVGDVIGKGESPVSETSEDALQVGEHVLNGHDDGDDSLDSSIDGSSQPGGPSSLGSSRDDEVKDGRDSQRQGKVLDGIHGLDSRLDHGQSLDPEGVVGAIVEKASPSVGQDSVLSSRGLGGISAEDVGLRWHIAQVGSDNASVLAEDLDESVSVSAPSSGRTLSVGALVDVQLSSVLEDVDVIGDADGEVVAPQFRGCASRRNVPLAGKIEDVDGVARASELRVVGPLEVEVDGSNVLHQWLPEISLDTEIEESGRADGHHHEEHGAEFREESH